MTEAALLAFPAPQSSRLLQRFPGFDSPPWCESAGKNIAHSWHRQMPFLTEKSTDLAFLHQPTFVGEGMAAGIVVPRRGKHQSLSFVFHCSSSRPEGEGLTPRAHP